MEFNKRDIKIIILSGKANSGKSTIANILKDNLDNSIVLSYASYLKMYAKEIVGWDGNENTKPRTFLQELGVELIKDKIDDKMLINRIIEDIEVYSYFYKYIIISDARFEDEISMIKDNFDKVSVIHVIGTTSNLTDEQKSHITETALDNYHSYDFELINDKDMDKLKENILKIVGEL